ncbi:MULTISPECIES: hypothetical protein [Frankia]|uniref:hypothetical protein n=1 Tax=Frankia TaxID=1854 RepID=UPI0012FFB6A8|nr:MULTISPECIES: hypothetical protein [Frankia]
MRGGTGAHGRLLRRVRPDVLHVNRCVPWACAPMLAAGLTAGVAGCDLRVVAVDQLPQQ